MLLPHSKPCSGRHAQHCRYCKSVSARRHGGKGGGPDKLTSSLDSEGRYISIFPSRALVVHIPPISPIAMHIQEQAACRTDSQSSSGRSSNSSEADEKQSTASVGHSLQTAVSRRYTGMKETIQEARDQITFKQRMKHFTWAWFTFPMSTGGIAMLLGVTPHRFPGLDAIGKALFIFDLFVFVLLCIGISARFMMNRGALRWSLTHPTESLLFPTFFLALVSLFGGIQIYGVPNTGPWLITVERVAFWIYVPMTFTSAVCQYTVRTVCSSMDKSSHSPCYSTSS